LARIAAEQRATRAAAALAAREAAQRVATEAIERAARQAAVQAAKEAAARAAKVLVETTGKQIEEFPYLAQRVAAKPAETEFELYIRAHPNELPQINLSDESSHDLLKLYFGTFFADRADKEFTKAYGVNVRVKGNYFDQSILLHRVGEDLFVKTTKGATRADSAEEITRLIDDSDKNGGLIYVDARLTPPEMDALGRTRRAVFLCDTSMVSEMTATRLCPTRLLVDWNSLFGCSESERSELRKIADSTALSRWLTICTDADDIERRAERCKKAGFTPIVIQNNISPYPWMGSDSLKALGPIERPRHAYDYTISCKTYRPVLHDPQLGSIGYLYVRDVFRSLSALEPDRFQSLLEFYSNFSKAYAKRTQGNNAVTVVVPLFAGGTAVGTSVIVYLTGRGGAK
jgi:hypothetical protein